MIDKFDRFSQFSVDNARHVHFQDGKVPIAPKEEQLLLALTSATQYSVHSDEHGVPLMTCLSSWLQESEGVTVRKRVFADAPSGVVVAQDAVVLMSAAFAASASSTANVSGFMLTICLFCSLSHFIGNFLLDLF